MTRFTGYARRDEPKWFYLLVGLITTAVLLLGLLIAILAHGWLDDQINGRGRPLPTSSTTTTATTPTTTPVITVRGGITVEKMAFTSGMDENNQPVDELEHVALAENGTVYCYTRVRCKTVPQEIHHVWLGPSGAVTADIKLSVAHSPSDTYSYISLLGTRPGKWEMQVRDEAGKVIAGLIFTTF